MDDLAQFLRARYDEEAAEAQAATPGPWWYNPGKQWLGPEAFEKYDTRQGEEFVGYGGPHPFTGAVAATGPASNPQSMRDAAFIARHDPARVLRDIEARRRMLDLHAYSTGHSCSTTDETGYHLNYADVSREDACTTLRLLALPYADHPDYREEWREQLAREAQDG